MSGSRLPRELARDPDIGGNNLVQQGLDMRPFMATLALLLFGAPAYAADAGSHEAFCEIYAGNALAYVRATTEYTGTLISELGATFGKNRDFTSPCGFSGPRWSADYSEHYNWCMGQSEATVNAERDARLADAKFCAICLEYAPAAFGAEASGRAARCPLSGADWPGTAEGLFQWCMRRNHDNPQTLIRRLENMLSDAKDEVNACEAARRRTKVTLPHAPSMADKPKTPQGPLSDTPCKWCKSKSNVRGATQQGGGNAMDNLGNNLNNSNLGAVSGSSGGAEMGRRATPPSTSQTNSASPSAGAPSRSDTEPAVNNRIMNIPNPTFNTPNTIR